MVCIAALASVMCLSGCAMFGGGDESDNNPLQAPAPQASNQGSENQPVDDVGDIDLSGIPSMQVPTDETINPPEGLPADIPNLGDGQNTSVTDDELLSLLNGETVPDANSPAEGDVDGDPVIFGEQPSVQPPDSDEQPLDGITAVAPTEENKYPNTGIFEEDDYGVPAV